VHRVPSRQAENQVHNVQNGTRGSAEFKASREPEIKSEVKLELEIKQEPFTIQGYFGFDK
jgi:hypothetical protein